MIVVNMLNNMLTYFKVVKVVKDNGCLPYHSYNQKDVTGYPTMIFPEDYLTGWVKEMSQAFEALQGRFRDVSALDDEQLAISITRCVHDYYRHFTRVPGLVGTNDSLRKAAVEAEEKTRKALEEGGMWETFHVHHHQEEEHQRMKNLVLAVQNEVERIQMMAKKIADAIDRQWMPKLLPID